MVLHKGAHPAFMLRIEPALRSHPMRASIGARLFRDVQAHPWPHGIPQIQTHNTLALRVATFKHIDANSFSALTSHLVALSRNFERGIPSFFRKNYDSATYFLAHNWLRVLPVRQM